VLRGAGAGADDELFRRCNCDPNLSIRTIERLIDRRICDRVLGPNLPGDVDRDGLNLIDARRVVCDPARSLGQPIELVMRPIRGTGITGQADRIDHDLMASPATSAPDAITTAIVFFMNRLLTDKRKRGILKNAERRGYRHEIVSSAPMVINEAPTPTRQPTGSLSHIAASRIVNGKLSLSMGATRDAGPSCSARKYASQETPVARPERTRAAAPADMNA
jgi:hypothetical protein